MANTRNWSDLLPELLILVVGYVDVNVVLPRLRAVCRHWRSVIPLPITSPSYVTDITNSGPHPEVTEKWVESYLKNYPSSHINDVYDSTLRSHLIESKLFLITPKGGKPWLTRLINIGPRVWKVGSLCSLNNEYFYSRPKPTGQMNLLDSNVLELARTWKVVISIADSNLLSVSRLNSLRADSVKVVGGGNRFLIKYKPSKNHGLGDPDYDEWLSTKLLFKYSSHDDEWLKIKNVDGDNYQIADIAYYKDKFYLVDLGNWKVGVIDSRKLEFSIQFMDAPGVLELGRMMLADGFLCRVMNVYLVACEHQLYMLIELKRQGASESERDVRFLPFVLKQGDNGWERVRDLGNQTLFIFPYVSFGVSKLDGWSTGLICVFKGGRGRVYPCRLLEEYLPQGHSFFNVCPYWSLFGIFSMEEEEKGIVEFSDLSQHKYTRLFFPPPAWVKWRVYDRQVFLHYLNMHSGWS